jgi:hypothetical protein
MNAGTVSMASDLTNSETITAKNLIKSGGTSTQFLKADGSTDSSAYLPLSGGALIGQVTSNQTPILTTQLTTKKYADKTALQSINSSYLSTFPWTQRNTFLGETQLWYSVCWSPKLSLFVSVSNAGSVMTSSNGINWNVQTGVPVGAWYSVCWSHELSLFVSVASTGSIKVMTSPDGITWTAQTTPVVVLKSVIWVKEISKFVSVGSGVCITSVDGITWVSQAIGAYNWNSVCYSPELSLLVAVTANRVSVSADGITWTNSAGLNANIWNSICWAAELGLFISVSQSGTSRIGYSTNGTTWTYILSPNDNSWWTVIWARELGLLVSVSYDGTNRVMTSSDGITWTGQLSANESNGWDGLCWAKEINQLVAVSYNGTNRVMTNNLKSVDISAIDASYIPYTLYFTSTAVLSNTTAYFPATGMSAIGSTTTAVAQASTNSFTKIFKCNNPYSSVFDGAKSGYVGSLTFPKLWIGSGFIWNMNFGIGDTNIAATSVCQMLCGFSYLNLAPPFNSTAGPNTASNIMGVGCDLGDTVLSFYSRGASGGSVKTPTTFSCATPSALWFNLTVFNQNNSNIVSLLLTEQTTGVSASISYNCNTTASLLNNSLLYPLYVRGMATSLGITNSAQCLVNKFQLFLK